MLQKILVCLVALVAVHSGTIAAAAQVEASAVYIFDDPNTGPSGYDYQVDPFGPVTASVADPNDKANASATANYGLLGAEAEIDPDFGSPMVSAGATASFSDTLTITADQHGVFAMAYIRMRVRGTIQQPFIVSEVTGVAQAEAWLGASSSIGNGYDSETFTASGSGSPVVNSFDHIVGIALAFTTGEPFTFGASLAASAYSQDLNVDPSAIKFSALFGSTAELLPIQIWGVRNPAASSESGVSYAIVPEPSAALLALAGSALLCARRRIRK